MNSRDTILNSNNKNADGQAADFQSYISERQDLEMEGYTFIDRYFHSQHELVDFRDKERRDINTLFSFLNNLHSLSDKIKKKRFDVNLSVHPEFKLLRILRNYFYHVGDIDEIRMFVNIQPDVSLYHIEQILIPMRMWAEAVNSFVEKNAVPENNSRYKDKQKFINKELDSIVDICDCVEVLRNPKSFCRPLLLKCDGIVIELGFDIFKFVYNISNIIADECRNIPNLASKMVIKDLGETYCAYNNIPKYDLMIRPSIECILTTEGYIFPTKIEKEI